MRSARVVPELIGRHADDVAFFWLLRDIACRAPHYGLADLAKLDGRIEAQFEALRLDLRQGWRACRRNLALKKPGETFAACVLGFPRLKAARIEATLKASLSTPANQRAAASALGWLPADQAMNFVRPLFAGTDPAQRRLAVATAAVHRVDPGANLQRLYRDADPRVRERAFRAAGKLGASAVHPDIRKATGDADLAVRVAACWTTLRLQPDPSVLADLQTLAQREQSPHRRAIVALIVRRLPPALAYRWLEVLRILPRSERLAVFGFGQLGDPRAIPQLLAAMAAPPLARVAGEAFEMITGAYLYDEKLIGKRPEGFEAGPTESPADENVDLDPDENLPWPDVAKVRGWWSANQSRFNEGTSYLLGKPRTPETLREVLRAGRQRQRAAAALELALAKPTEPLFNVHAPGFRQQAQLMQSPK